MKMLIGGRASGKTTQLIKIAAKQNTIIVCRSNIDCNRIFERSILMGLEITFPITYADFIFNNGNRFSKDDKQYLIDDAFKFLNTVSPNISVITVDNSNMKKANTIYNDADTSFGITVVDVKGH